MTLVVAFDFDGTLVDSNVIKRQSFYDIACAFHGGKSVMRRILSRSFGKDRYWIFDQFRNSMSLTIDEGALVDRYTALTNRRVSCAPEIEGAGTTLSRLGEMGVRMFVNSATPTPALVNILCARKLDRHFKGILGSPRTKEYNLKSILNVCKVEPSQLVMVGDSELDRVAACNVGCHFVGLDNGDTDFSVLPAYRIQWLTSLLDIIQEL